MTRLNDILEHLPMYASDIAYEADLLVWKKADREDALRQLKALVKHITGFTDEDFSSVKALEGKLKAYIDDSKLETGNVLWPMRTALSGQKNSPSPFELAWVFGKMETLKRLETALKKLS